MPLSAQVPYRPVWVEENTTLDVETLDNWDYGLLHAYYQSESMWLVNGASEELTYSGGKITQVNLKNSSNQTLRRISITYSGDNISRIDYYVYNPDQPGSMVTWLHYYDVLTYSSGNLTKTTRTVVSAPTGGA